jgi:hypothetical protein
MATYVLSIIFSAFLVFQIQPLVARAILPWFGGTPAVWSTVMLFFQVALTAGYSYAWWLVSRLPARRQGIVHLLVLGGGLAAVIFLGLVWPSPVTPGVAWKPDDAARPVARILGMLSVAVGLPFFTLAANSPLLQAWVVRTASGRSPYWLYAVSNAGSLVALLSYPVLIEPALTLRQQGWCWAIGYLAFAVLTSAVALKLHRREQAVAAPAAAHTAPLPISGLSMNHQLLWLLLSTVTSTLLLAVTSHITQEVAVIPFLWILPLAVYLLTFTIVFSSERYYHRPLFAGLFALTSCACVYVFMRTDVGIAVQIALFLGGLFSACMLAHGELYRLRPDPSHLTRFYLVVSVGGALGGVLVTLVFPVLCDAYWELPLAWAAVWLLLAVLTFVRPSEEVPRSWRGEFDAAVGGMAITSLLLAGYAIVRPNNSDVLSARNFYGILRVRAEREPRAFSLVHGVTRHGAQLTDAARRTTPTTYYWTGSGIGLALTSHPKRGHGLHVGVLGLGVGTLAAYGQPGDRYRFYEINPIVADLANGRGGYFTFLRDTPAAVQVVLGDARVSLERELAAGSPQGFDVLVLDTFSSDAVPVHLITREAFGLYLGHLAPGGVIAAHITNRHLELTPVLWQIAQARGLQCVLLRVVVPGGTVDAASSTWMLLTRDQAAIAAPEILAKGDRLDAYSTTIGLWTDDYSNLFQVLK